MGWEKRACVHGLVDGMEKDTVENPLSKQALLSRVSWLGMGKSKLDERKCERLVRCMRLDMKLLNKGLPEEMRTGEVLYLGNGLEAHTSSKKVWMDPGEVAGVALAHRAGRGLGGDSEFRGRRLRTGTS
jgi:hypothetical protein